MKHELYDQSFLWLFLIISMTMTTNHLTAQPNNNRCGTGLVAEVAN
jgi:hypothetical protein